MPQKNASLLALLPLLSLAPALACVAPRSLAALYIACGVLCVAAFFREHGRFPSIPKGWLYAITAFTGYGALSYFWSVNAEETVRKAFELGGVFVLSAAVYTVIRDFSSDVLTKLSRYLVAGFFIGLAVFAFEQVTDFYLYSLVRGGVSYDVADVKQNKAAYLLLLWGFLAFPFVKRETFALIAMGIVYAVFSSASMSSQLVVLGAPVLCGALALMPSRFSLWLTLLSSVAIVVLMPVLSVYAYQRTNMTNLSANTSVISRIEIWNQVAARVSEKPLFGWGLDGASKLPNRDEVSKIPAYAARGTPIAHLHPHNAPLQIWFELGAVGIAFLCGLFLTFYRRLLALPSDLPQKYGVFIWVVVFLHTLSIWGIWQSWFIASLCFAAVVTAVSTSRR